MSQEILKAGFDIKAMIDNFYNVYVSKKRLI